MNEHFRVLEYKKGKEKLQHHGPIPKCIAKVIKEDLEEQGYKVKVLKPLKW